MQNSAEDDDLQEWMDQLAGRKEAPPHVAALRQAIQQHRQTQEQLLAGPADAQRTEQELAKLLERIRQLEQPAQAPGATRAQESWWERAVDRIKGSAQAIAQPRQLAWAFSAVASVAALAFVLSQVIGTAPGAEFEIYDGPAPGLRDGQTANIKSENPERSARHLAAIAAEFGASPALFREGARVTVVFDVGPNRVPAAQSKADAAKLGVKIKEGANSVTFE